MQPKEQEGMTAGGLFILTGAGISAESGLATFRGAGGLWEGHPVEDVATPEAFARDPDLVLGFYDARRAQLADVAPNAAHLALARLEREWPGDFLLVTQNVDDLHERAGSQQMVHMHGALKSALCLSCGGRSPWEGDLLSRPACPRCDMHALRPDIVWFGEIPYDMDRIERALASCSLFVAIGTSGQVWPAAGFARAARMNGAQTVEINVESADTGHDFTRHYRGPAGLQTPAFVADMLQGLAVGGEET